MGRVVLSQAGKVVDADAIEIAESDYYILLASLHSSENSVLPHEESAEIDPDAEQGEAVSSRPMRR